MQRSSFSTDPRGFPKKKVVASAAAPMSQPLPVKGVGKADQNAEAATPPSLKTLRPSHRLGLYLRSLPPHVLLLLSLLPFVLLLLCLTFSWAPGYHHDGILSLVTGGVSVAYVMAFYSLYLQVDGLIGAKVGILPLDEYLRSTEDHWKKVPLFHLRWLSWAFLGLWKFVGSSKYLKASHIAFAGVLCATLCFLSHFTAKRDSWIVLVQLISFCLLHGTYLSFRWIGQEFVSFQCDTLLLESGFLCCFCPLTHYATALSSTLMVSCFRLLLFKIVWTSGIMKILLACPSWASGRALDYLFWTQPLPSPLLKIFLGISHKKFLSNAIIYMELFAPFLMFLPRQYRILCFLLICGLCLLLSLTGNFGFFYHLIVILSFSILDDRVFSSFGGIFISDYLQESASLSEKASRLSLWNVFGYFGATVFLLLFVAIFVVYSLANMVSITRIWRLKITFPHFLETINEVLATLDSCNSYYGLFAIVTTFRHELVISELHYDRQEKRQKWVELKFLAKLSGVNGGASLYWWGHMPRLDFRLWFLPLWLATKQSDSQTIKNFQTTFAWFWKGFLTKLKERQPNFMELLGPQTFDIINEETPLAVKIELYDYLPAPPDDMSYVDLFSNYKKLSKSDIPMDIFDADNTITKNWEIGTWWLRKKIHTFRELPS